MRQECKNFESRTYRNGETVRKCNLGLAPDAPWRCPADCAGYERRLADQAWTHGSLVTPPTPDEPSSVADGTAAAVLGEAMAIVEAVSADVRADVDAERQRSSDRRRRWWHRLRR